MELRTPQSLAPMGGTLKSMSLKTRLKHRLLRTNQRLLGLAGVGVASLLSKTRFGLPGGLRLIVDFVQPVDPLRKVGGVPAIELVIPFVLKDLDVLPLAIRGAVRSSRNQIQRVLLLTPRRTMETVGNLDNFLARERAELAELGVQEVSLWIDEDILDPDVQQFIKAQDLPPRDRGWITQQIVKLAAVMQSELSGTLIVDADTVLMFSRTWLSHTGEQLLMIGQESRDPFFSFANAYLGITARSRLSFVTHHQLMQKSLLSEILISRGGVLGLLRKSLSEGPSSSPLRAISEYEIYGAFLSEMYPHLTRFATWGNGSGKRDELGSNLSEAHPWALSVSYHHYLSRSGVPDSLL